MTCPTYPTGMPPMPASVARQHVDRLVRLEDAALHIRAVTGCPKSEAHRIVRVLGAGATHSLAGLIAAHDVSLEALAAALTTDDTPPGTATP